jgi:nicotinate-nucleotide adenylyltransferase
MRVGLYGGTFDPIHNGHLHVIEQLIARNIVDYLLVLPAGEPRLRENTPVATGAQRRTMCQLAVNSLPAEIKSKIEVNPIEVLRMGPSYTIDTVEAVKQVYPDDELILIIGTDAYEKLDQWHRIEDLKKLVRFEVIQRPDYPFNLARDIDALAVSATAIRTGQSDAIPAPVAEYIKEQNLYVS